MHFSAEPRMTNSAYIFVIISLIDEDHTLLLLFLIDII